MHICEDFKKLTLTSVHYMSQLNTQKKCMQCAKNNKAVKKNWKAPTLIYIKHTDTNTKGYSPSAGRKNSAF